MSRSRFVRTGGLAGLFVVGSVLLTVAWCAPAQADGSSGLGYKIVGASYIQELRFANCMRDHGEPGFPDTNSDGVFYSNRIDTNSPEYQAAQRPAKTCSQVKAALTGGAGQASGKSARLRELYAPPRCAKLP